MAKRIAVLVRERQEEALRVALGLTLDDAGVEVYVLDRALAPTPRTREFLAALADAGVPVSGTAAGGSLPSVTAAEVARRVLACDHVVPY